MPELLPRTRKWVAENKKQTQETFLEYLYNIEYHFNRAFDYHPKVMMGIVNLQGVKVGDSSARIENFAPDSSLLLGDMVIREYASSVETTWLLVNHVLGLNVKQNGLHWKPWKDEEQDDLSLKQAMIKASKYSDLVAFIDSIHESPEHIYLSSYRNWVTHRGAPRLIFNFNISEPIPIPPGVMNGDATSVNVRISNYLKQIIPPQVDICCAPFVHKIHEYIGTPPRPHLI